MTYICPFCEKEVVGEAWDLVFLDFNPRRAHVECNKRSLAPPAPNIASTGQVATDSNQSEGTPETCR